MKTTDWKAAAELIGNSAIVASLIIVFYEVSQATFQAESETSKGLDDAVGLE